MILKFFLLFSFSLSSTNLIAAARCNPRAAHNSAAYQACGIQPTIAPVPTSLPTPVQTPRPTVTPIPTPQPTRTIVPKPANTPLQTPAPALTPTPAPALTPTQPQIAVPTKMPYAVPSLVPTLPVSATPTPPQMAVPTKMPYAVPSLVPTLPVSVTPTPPQMAVPTKMPYAVPSLAPSQMQGTSKNKNGPSTKQIKVPTTNQQISPDVETPHSGLAPRPTVTFPVKNIKKEDSSQIGPQDHLLNTGNSHSVGIESVTPEGVDKSEIPSTGNGTSNNKKKKAFIPLLGIEEPIHSVWLILLLLAGLGLFWWHKKSR
ncbi:MAG: hypothetical protein KC493_17930 [Bacteriovoracaceae bacterium]|nr:hypothetical protein [Bacteriovoracaceae bacterium]